MASGKVIRPGILKSGTENYTHSTAQTVVQVTFDEAFEAVPNVVITAFNSSGYAVRAWIRSITASGFYANVYLDNFSTSFSGALHWIAHL